MLVYTSFNPLTGFFFTQCSSCVRVPYCAWADAHRPAEQESGTGGRCQQPPPAQRWDHSGRKREQQNIGTFLYKDKNRGQGGVSSHHQISFKLEEQMLVFGLAMVGNSNPDFLPLFFLQCLVWKKNSCSSLLAPSRRMVGRRRVRWVLDSDRPGLSSHLSGSSRWAISAFRIRVPLSGSGSDFFSGWKKP